MTNTPLEIDDKKYACNDCLDEGWLYSRDENGYIFQRECPCGCLKKQRLANRLKFANIPEQFKDMRMNTFKVNAYQKETSREQIRTDCKAIAYWIDHFDEMQSKGKGLYLYSSAKGSGKTRMAVSIANKLMHDMNKQVKFATSMQIIDEIKATWSDKGDKESQLLDALVTTEVLVIDDFGTEQVKEWVSEKFYSIINGRYIDKRITIFTSNCAISNLKYDGRITNRLMEMCYLIPFPEESVRETISNQDNNDLFKAIGVV